MPAPALAQLSSAWLDNVAYTPHVPHCVPRVQCNQRSISGVVECIECRAATIAQPTVISPAVKGHKLCERLAEKGQRRGKGEHPLIWRTKAAHYFVKNATVKTENREKLQK